MPGVRPWALTTWPRGDPRAPSAAPARCGSWRCAACRPWRAFQDFDRLRQALEPAPEHHVVFMVLTFAQREWSDPWAAYRAVSRQWRVLARRLERAGAGFRGATPRGTCWRWAMVVEQHRSGWPHANVLAWAPGLAADVAANVAQAEAEGHRDRWAILVRGTLREAVLSAGFGPQSTADILRERKGGLPAAAGYVLKTAKRDADARERLAAEASKREQAPVNAPKGLRRLRSGKGFLPPAPTSPHTTGAMLAPCSQTADGPTTTWRPVGGWPDDARRQAEIALAARAATGVPIVPPFAREALEQWDAQDGPFELVLWRAAGRPVQRGHD